MQIMPNPKKVRAHVNSVPQEHTAVKGPPDAIRVRQIHSELLWEVVALSVQQVSIEIRETMLDHANSVLQVKPVMVLVVHALHAWQTHIARKGQHAYLVPTIQFHQLEAGFANVLRDIMVWGVEIARLVRWVHTRRVTTLQPLLLGVPRILVKHAQKIITVTSWDQHYVLNVKIMHFPQRKAHLWLIANVMKGFMGDLQRPKVHVRIAQTTLHQHPTAFIVGIAGVKKGIMEVGPLKMANLAVRVMQVPSKILTTSLSQDLHTKILTKIHVIHVQGNSTA
jgi:hypothetical protein